MDAKPQRFGRAPHPPMDENALVAPRALHQRFNSTGALPTTVSTIVPKATGKRPGLADVSNVARNTVVRDDSSIGTKSPSMLLEKAPKRIETNEIPFPRPAEGLAQRLPGLVGGMSQAPVGPTTADHPPDDEGQPSSVTRYLPRRRMTNPVLAPIPRDSVVFRDEGKNVIETERTRREAVDGRTDDDNIIDNRSLLAPRLRAKSETQVKCTQYVDSVTSGTPSTLMVSPSTISVTSSMSLAGKEDVVQRIEDGNEVEIGAETETKPIAPVEVVAETETESIGQVEVVVETETESIGPVEVESETEVQSTAVATEVDDAVENLTDLVLEARSDEIETGPESTAVAPSEEPIGEISEAPASADMAGDEVDVIAPESSAAEVDHAAAAVNDVLEPADDVVEPPAAELESEPVQTGGHQHPPEPAIGAPVIANTQYGTRTTYAGTLPVIDDVDEDSFDEDGYTTARSFRSRGENTTSGPTMVLLPRVTTQVKRELAIAKRIVEGSRSPEQIEDEFFDVSMVAEYSEEIFEYMAKLEMKLRPRPHYMDIQTEIQWSMRSILMDWLIQVHQRLGLFPETLFLSVNYIDRFLSQKVVSLGKLQLVGATALLIAAKYEEVDSPTLNEMVFMVDEAYSQDEIVKAERFMLNLLDFQLGWPGPMSFLRRVSKADQYDLETRTLAKYFLEAIIVDERFVACTPSFLAAGAHCLARFMLKKGEWSAAHVHYSGYTCPQLRQLMINILDCCEDARIHHMTVFEKYSDSRYKRASLYVEVEIARGFRLPDLRFNPILSCSSPAVNRRRRVMGCSSLSSYVTTATTSPSTTTTSPGTTTTTTTTTAAPSITDESDDGRLETFVSL